MSTILEELSKYREILSEGKCKFCHKPVELTPSANSRAQKFGGKASDYTSLFPNHAECELANRKKGDSEAAARRRNAVKEGIGGNKTQGNVDRLLELLNGYAEKINQLSMVGKSTEKYQLMMDKVEETIGSYPDGQQRLDDFWTEYNDSFSHDYEPMSEGVVNEYQNPAELPEIEAKSAGIELGKHNAMEELGEIVASIPAHQEIPYEEFGKTLVGLHRTFQKGSDAKVVDFTRGWNMILQKVNEMIPKSRTRHLTKDELQSVIAFVGEKELNWN
jgi:hypothetical protein